MLVTLVCPAFKEEEVLPLFHQELDDVLARLDSSYRVEILYVDDGSPDRTLGVMKTLAARDPRVRYLSLSRNFGKEAALLAGLEHARGDVVISLDTDLQHPPGLIPVLLEKWREGFDVVLTIKEEDRTLGLGKRLTSKLFYKWMGRFSKLSFVEASADFCLLTRRAVDSLVRLREGHRFMRGMVQWLGFPAAKVRFRPVERSAGHTKYNFVRLVALASDGVFSFSCAPLRLATYLGFVALVVGLVQLAWLVPHLVAGSSPASLAWSYLMITLHVLGGAILCCLGILGEYVGRIFEEVKGRPVYLLKEQSKESSLPLALPSQWDAASRKAHVPRQPQHKAVA